MAETLRRREREVLIGWARDAQPLEACGFVLSDGTAVRVPNLSEDKNRFIMDKKIVLQLHEIHHSFAAVWHSHPEGQQHPSNADCRNHPADIPMLIVTLDTIWEWDLSSGIPIRIGEL